VLPKQKVAGSNPVSRSTSQFTLRTTPSLGVVRDSWAGFALVLAVQDATEAAIPTAMAGTIVHIAFATDNPTKAKEALRDAVGATRWSLLVGERRMSARSPSAGTRQSSFSVTPLAWRPKGPSATSHRRVRAAASPAVHREPAGG
jgi:hypothetical protein